MVNQNNGPTPACDFNPRNAWGKILSLFILFTVLGLPACGGGPNRIEDAASLPQDVPAEVAPPSTATPAPDSPPTEGASPAQETPPTVEPQPQSSQAITFSVSGGIVGFCDTLTVSPAGDYNLDICSRESYTGILGEPDKSSLQAWVDNLADFQITLEDNPGGPDNLVTKLIFDGNGQTEADENQQKVILDWAGGLAIRLRPQPTPPAPAATEPAPVGDQGLCPDVARPALLTLNLDNPTVLTLLDPNSQSTCNLALQQPAVGRIAAAGGSIFYPVFDSEAKTVSVLQLNTRGEHIPLAFTAIPMEEPGPYDFVVSDDGSKIAWANTLVNVDSDPPVFTNSLWAANVDGTAQITILGQAANNELRFVAPVRFSPGSDTLYYALQPDIGGPVLSGRFDTLYRVPVSGGQSQLFYACPGDNPACIAGLSPDGSTLAVMKPAEAILQLLNRDGAVISTVPLPAADYTERAAFSPAGNLAFVTAALTQTGQDSPPLPSPGYISLMTPPYAGPPQTLLSDNTIATLLGWLDDHRLTFGTIDAEGNTGASLLTLDGQVTPLLSDTQVAVGVMR